VLSRSEIAGSFEMWCWGRMEKIGWIDCVRNEELLKTVEEKRNIPHTIKIRKADPMVTS